MIKLFSRFKLKFAQGIPADTRDFAVVITCFVAVGLLNISCSTFRGPGDFKGGGIDSAGNEVGSGHSPISTPTVTYPPLAMNGARGYTKAKDSTGDLSGNSIVFNWPVDEASLSRGFLAAPIKRKKPHWGLDLANSKGTPILAAAKGTVVYTGHAFKGYGKLIVIEHNSDWATLYAHLNKISVKEGQIIEQGEKIGEMGRTGKATGVHLHFEMRHFRQPVNPLAYLPAVAPQSNMASQFRVRSFRLSSQGSQLETQ